MKNKNRNIAIFLIYVVCYIISMAFSYNGYYYLSGPALGIAAIALYMDIYIKTKNPIHLKGLFSLFFIGGQSISCLKLSALQKPWSLVTWLCFFLAYTCFCLGYDRWDSSYHNRRSSFYSNQRFRFKVDRLYYATLAVTLVSLTCFSIEALVLGFIPLFSKEPHAYSYFHISGVHYFTVACILVPALSVIYLACGRKISASRKIIVSLCTLLSFMIPILCVSRFQLIMMILLAVVTYVSLAGNLRLSHIGIAAIGFLALVVPVYLLLTVARNHDVEYLNGIFEMKNSGMPIFITQPYIYIANNYDNFNCLVEQIPGHTFGLRMLFPLWVFTGLKFLYPQLVNIPIYVTKTELTTVTLIYDAYYDFGIIGIIGFALLCGFLCSALARLAKNSKNPVAHLFYGQTAIYLILSFFTTWFSNPTTWFWYGITAIVFWFVG